MTQSEVYESPVDGGLARVEAVSEAAYHDAWVEHALPREPDLLAMAISGGLIADRLAWVFVAGYQAACRHVFPTATLRSWVSYAATEDRENDPPLPGVPSQWVTFGRNALGEQSLDCRGKKRGPTRGQGRNRTRGNVLCDGS